MKTKAFIIFFFLSGFDSAQASGKNENGNYSVKRFSIETGLPNFRVNKIVQDQNGFLWIGTGEGLSRYDGYEFRNYYHNPNDSTSLPYFIATDVEVDRYNTVWVKGSGLSLSYYRRSDERFHKTNLTGIRDIALDTAGNLWAACVDSIRIWDEGQNGFQAFKTVQTDTPSINLSNIRHIAFDNQNNLLLYYGYHNNTYLFFKGEVDGRNTIFFKYMGKIPEELTLTNRFISETYFFPFVSKTGKYWLVGIEGNYLLDEQTREFKKFPGNIPDAEMAGLSPWLRDEYVHKQKWYSQDQAKFDQAQFPGFLFVESSFQDRQGTNWLVLLNEPAGGTGLTRCIEKPTWFRHYFTEKNKNGLADIFFNIVKDRNGTIRAAPRSGNILLSNDSGRITKKFLPVYDLLEREGSYPRSILADSTGLWIGYTKRLLLYYDYSTGKFSKKIYDKTNPDERSFPFTFIHIIKEKNDLLLFSYLGIYRINTSTLKIKPLWVNSNTSENMYSYLSDGEGGWYAGFNFSRIRHINSEFKADKTYQLVNMNFNVESIVKGNHNDLYAALLGSGLAHVDLATGKSKIFTTADGLSNNTCYSILKDKKGNLWISTNQGISRFNPNTGKFRVFGPEDGLKITEFNSDAVFQAPDGEMFFGGVGGIVSFYPDSINETKNEERRTKNEERKTKNDPLAGLRSNEKRRTTNHKPQTIEQSNNQTFKQSNNQTIKPHFSSPISRFPGSHGILNGQYTRWTPCASAGATTTSRLPLPASIL